MNGKRYFNEIKKGICLHQLFSKLHNYFSTKSPHISISLRQRCASFWNPSLKKLVFCFWNHFLTAGFTLPNLLLYSHQHTDHHKRLAFICEFELEELFPRLTIQQQHAVWTERLKTLPVRCALGEDCKRLSVQGEVWWKRDTMWLHRGFIQICLM